LANLQQRPYSEQNHCFSTLDMTAKKIKVIINPISGIGQQKIVPQLIKEQINNDSIQVDIVYTKYAQHATELAQQAVTESYYAVAIVGGDGSVNEVGKALVGSQTALAIIPTGSGNGLARHLKIPLELKSAIELLNQHRIRTIDTGLFNSHFFVGVCGIGFDGLIAKRFSEFGKRGFASYIRIILTQYFQFKRATYTVSSSNKSFQQKAFLVTMANSSQYGNRVTVAPSAKVDDGIFELCLLRRLPLYAMPLIAYRFFTKTIHLSKYMTIIKGTEFEIESDYSMAHVDGEPVSCLGVTKITIQPASLQVIVLE